MQRAGTKERTRSLERLDRAARQLRDVALILANEDYDTVAALRAAVFDTVPREELLQAARAVDELAHRGDRG